MSLFGYVCSPLCRNKADSRGMNIPVYEFQKSVLEAKRWRKIGLLAWGIGGAVASYAFSSPQTFSVGASGAIFGLTRDSGRDAIVTATLQSIAYQTRDLLDAMGM